MSLRTIALLGFASALGCADEPAPERPSAPAPVGEPVSEIGTAAVAAWAGCDDYVGEACLFVVRDRLPTVRAWLDAPPSVPFDVRIDGVEVRVESVAIDGGTRVRVEVPAGAREIVVKAPGVQGHLPLVWHESDPAILAARAASDQGARDEICAALKRVPPGASGHDQLEATGLSTWCVDAADPGRALEIFEHAAEIAASHRLRRGFVRGAYAALFMRLEREGDEARAQRWLERMPEYAEGNRELEVLAFYCKALVLRRQGALSEALEAMTRSVRWAKRLDMPRDFIFGSEIQATLLAELGHVSESRALAAELSDAAATHDNPCDRARILNNATWTEQVLADAGLAHDAPLDLMLEEAEIYETGACDDTRSRTIARINVGMAALFEHDIELAREWLERLVVEDRDDASDDLRAQIDYLALGVALASNRWDVAALPLLATAPAHGDARLRWRAAVREAQVLERFGIESAALDAWRGAEALLDEDAAAVGVGSGRETFISGRTTSIIGLVEALLRAGDVGQAMCRARIARGRALRRAVRGRGGAPAAIAAFDEFLRVRQELEHDAADDWSHAGDELERRRARRNERRRRALDALATALPDVSGDSECAALRPRGDDELLLLLMPTREDTIAIAQSPSGMLVERLPPIPDDEPGIARWGGDLLARISTSLEGVSLVRVLPIGRAWSVPLHAAALDGAPLVERVAVAYGLDLPAVRMADHDRARALVVADPTGDLPHATAEGERVRETLDRQGVPVEVLTGTSALREDVLARIARADLLHYSGHGEHRGADGWDDALLLHDGASVEPADVLALPHAPRTVVLAGCDTGAVNAGLFDGGMNLGRAFLLAGSDAVVVGDRKVDDAVTETFAVALYEGSAPRMLDAPELAMQDALRTTATRGVPIDAWSVFRLLVR